MPVLGNLSQAPIWRPFLCPPRGGERGDCVLCSPLGSAAAPDCQLIPGEGPLNSDSFYQSLSGGVLYSKNWVVWPFSPFANSSMVSFSVLGSQTYFPNVHTSNRPALCNYSAVAPQEPGLGASRLPAVRTWGHRDSHSLSEQRDLVQKVSMMPHREWSKSSPALSTSSFHRQ